MNTRFERTKAKLTNMRNHAITKLKVWPSVAPPPPPSLGFPPPSAPPLPADNHPPSPSYRKKYKLS